MWHTSSGDRTVSGAEAKLLKAAITGIVELIQEERGGFADQWEYGVRLYDELHWSQRLALLDQIATYLFTPTAEFLELTAVNEAAIGAVFAHLRVELDWETDGLYGDSTRWHYLVDEAYAEMLAAEPEEESDGDEYELDLGSRIEILADRILWDEDYDLYDTIMDAPPEKGAFLKSFMGIDEDYFADAPPDIISEVEVEGVIRRLSELTTS